MSISNTVSQFDFSCNSEDNWEDGVNQHFHRDVADADLATPNRTECLFCVTLALSPSVICNIFSVNYYL